MEVYVLDCLSYFMMVMAFLNCVTLLFEHVPYGRYAPSSYGFPVHVKFAWFVQELPCAKCVHNQLLLLMFIFHYFGYFMHLYLISLHELKHVFLLGSCMWLLGCIINIHSNHILRNLRKPGETDYKIPRGGMFEYVSGANFFGEIWLLTRPIVQLLLSSLSLCCAAEE
uniref:3-oxo-5-alpha-steroid 4-dehydrogenase C-terminal domain-containing protein n=1 Tax=Cyprinus carpio TaxID=7962 RepID=A0A8C1Q737_CYPCA